MEHTDRAERLELDHRGPEEPVPLEEGFEASEWDTADPDEAPPPIAKPSPEVLVRDSPALAQRGFFPETDFEDMEELRRDHVRLIDACIEAGGEWRGLRERFEAEDAEREAALKSAYRTGASPAEVAPVATPEETRKAQLDAAWEQVKAAQGALTEFLYEAVDKLGAGADGWLASLADERAEAERMREEAQAMLARADALVGSRRRLRNWIERSTGRRTEAGTTFRVWATRFYPFAEMPDPTDPAAREPLTENDMRSLADRGVSAFG